jgi:hypothetical protein
MMRRPVLLAACSLMAVGLAGLAWPNGRVQRLGHACARPALRTLVRDPLNVHALAAIVAACSSSPMAAPHVQASSTLASPIHVKGTERLAWDQVALDARDLSRSLFIAFVDDAPSPVAESTCQRASAGTFNCSAAVPAMAAGSTHKIELTSIGPDGSVSMRSVPIFVVLTSAR